MSDDGSAGITLGTRVHFKTVVGDSQVIVEGKVVRRKGTEGKWQLLLVIPGAAVGRPEESTVLVKVWSDAVTVASTSTLVPLFRVPLGFSIGTIEMEESSSWESATEVQPLPPLTLASSPALLPITPGLDPGVTPGQVGLTDLQDLQASVAASQAQMVELMQVITGQTVKVKKKKAKLDAGKAAVMNGGVGAYPLESGLPTMAALYGTGASSHAAQSIFPPAPPEASSDDGPSSDAEETSSEGEVDPSLPTVAAAAKDSSKQQASKDFLAMMYKKKETPHSHDLSGPSQLPASGSQVDVNLAVQAEILKTRQSLRREKKTSSASEATTSTEGEAGVHGPKGLRGLHRMRRRFKKKPGSIVRRYVVDAKTELGITSVHEAFHFKAYSMALRTRFGRMRGLFRVHLGLSHALNLGAVEGKPVEALAMVVQVQKAIEQAVLDKGRWDTAQWYLPYVDPYFAKRHAGTFVEVAGIAGYREVMSKLKLDGGEIGAKESDTEPDGTRADAGGSQNRAAPKRKPKKKKKGATEDA